MGHLRRGRGGPTPRLHRRAGGGGHGGLRGGVGGEAAMTAVHRPPHPGQRDGGYMVTVPTLRGCMTEGDTFEEAAGKRQGRQRPVSGGSGGE